MEIKSSLLILASIFAIGYLLSNNESKSFFALDSFLASKSKFNWNYSSESEFQFRLRIFVLNSKMISEHNKDLSQTYTLALNSFADKTYSELKSKYLGILPSQDKSKCELSSSIINDDVRKIDWREKKIVQEVKDQAQCGSCWAFSAVGSLEAAHALESGTLPSLSEQELVDCSRSYGNEGCNGGLMNFAFDYVKEHNINTEADYKYTARDGECQTKKIGEGKFGLKSCVRAVPNVNGLVDALKVKPVSVAFYAPPTFFFYFGGIWNPWHWLCSGEANHGVLAVGFDLDNELPYYIVKNSWGKGWGEKGFFRIFMGTDRGTCDMAGNGWNFYPNV